jgi:HAD superfamily hydrolase (TIGR01490 family)
MSEESHDTRFAFFDLDLTLVAYDSQLLFCNHVLRAEWWRRYYLIFFVPALALYALKILGDEGMKRIFLSYLWGMRRSRLEEYAASFVETVLPEVLYAEIAEEVTRQREAGRRTVMASASPEFYARAIAERLGFDECFGTRVAVGERVALFPRFEAPNNKHAAKLRAMREILPPESERPIADSYSFSDSSADLPLLELVEHPVMVHPSAKLRAVGREREWAERTPPRPYADDRGRNLAYARMALGLFSPGKDWR